MAAREDHFLHWPCAVVDIPPQGLEVERSATPEERAALAESFGLPAIHRLDASFRLSGTPKRVKVKGEVRARIEQICVVTLEPFASDVVEPIEVDFAAEPSKRALEERRLDDWDGDESRSRGGRRGSEPEGRSAEMRLSDADPPDEIVDGSIDLGQLAAEFLALGVDPYPRKPGAVFQTEDEEGDGASSRRDELREQVDKPSPFAALSRLRTKSEGQN
ncbi:MULTISPECIES: YceD family protein [unclassified Chelatococcus]|jgi:uncharacterized metal-binding protein YceD (DUF177 family)|uniref:YceD family protein n=1 Tax=unclassified Chelatococcus TaxID=2638111 RepID=UPI001BCE347D|nr:MULTISPECIES: YceD family protein [unclassified Chelatococcus]CAH1671481.1 conserved hypothetical protein [Hyphomicrobiales bacterium]MBS7738467.1 DUF177 domain-containing protein [Chelatococcus sp. HY11]MBX3542871.1 DUF177 domain-containing protein [Chelatococcus sp.]MCO5077003.1 DUF177 domain-containing protein [Chelatococcus sp.]CAH1676314.1 conserved hypothetical protein [Hyphomicrobiales bacterium]